MQVGIKEYLSLSEGFQLIYPITTQLVVNSYQLL